jgi:hypothetical protein
MVKYMSATHDRQSDWNFRLVDSRQVKIKGKSDDVHRVSVIDILTGLPFPLLAATDFPMDSLDIDKTYFFTFKIYTLKKAEGVAADFVEFFQVLDVNQSTEDFVKAYWLYPKYIKFELFEAEPL